MCKTQEEDEDEADEAMEVMNDIIGTLEADHISPQNVATGGSSSNKENESRNSRSLVVDIHLPPASEDDDEAEPEACSNVPVSTRPCKHEVNRFQRCYSDGSQASPKRKAKVTFLVSIKSCGAHKFFSP